MLQKAMDGRCEQNEKFSLTHELRTHILKKFFAPVFSKGHFMDK